MTAAVEVSGLKTHDASVRAVIWQSYAVLLVWAIARYAVVAWRLARRES